MEIGVNQQHLCTSLSLLVCNADEWFFSLFMSHCLAQGVAIVSFVSEKCLLVDVQ